MREIGPYCVRVMRDSGVMFFAPNEFGVGGEAIYVTMLPNNVTVCNRQCVCVSSVEVCYAIWDCWFLLFCFWGLCGFFVRQILDDMSLYGVI